MRVFVLGAGASKSCRLPLTNELLPGVLPAIDDPATRTGLEDFIRYLYPHFRSAWRNYPNLEELLSLIDTYLEFSPKVKRRPKYGNPEVIRFKRELLRAISIHLCQQVAHVKIQETQLFRLVRRLRRGDVVITFNWDFTVERALVELNRFGWVSYTLDPKKISLLKPHGSVDWFDSKEVRLAKDRTSDLIRGVGTIQVYMYFRFPQVEKQIVPVIIPPTIKKEFPHKEFDRIWTDTWKALRRASAIHVLGFSLPPEDLHVRFVIRSAIRGNEASRTRSLPVTIVNPDRNVFLRFARLVESPVTYFECGLEEVALDELLGSSRKPVRATLVEPLPKSD